MNQIDARGMIHIRGWKEYCSYTHYRLPPNTLLSITSAASRFDSNRFTVHTNGVPLPRPGHTESQNEKPLSYVACLVYIEFAIV